MRPDRPHDCEPAVARGDDRPTVVSSIPPYGSRQRRARRRLADELEAAGRRVRLRRRVEDRADAEVVRPRDGVELLRPVDCQADEPAGADCLACGGHLRVAPADVDAVRVAGDGEVGAVVDEKERARCEGELPADPAERDDLVVRRALQPQLDDVDAAGEGALEPGSRVGDEVEPGALEPVAQHGATLTGP